MDDLGVDPSALEISIGSVIFLDGLTIWTHRTNHRIELMGFMHIAEVAALGHFVDDTSESLP